jgi:hypothetical protein
MRADLSLVEHVPNGYLTSVMHFSVSGFVKACEK